MKKLTQKQLDKIATYAPSDVYTHNDGSPVAILWRRDRVETHRIMPTGTISVATRYFDEEDLWHYDVMDFDLGPQA